MHVDKEKEEAQKRVQEEEKKKKRAEEIKQAQEEARREAAEEEARKAAAGMGGGKFTEIVCQRFRIYIYFLREVIESYNVKMLLPNTYQWLQGCRICRAWVESPVWAELQVRVSVNDIQFFRCDFLSS